MKTPLLILTLTLFGCSQNIAELSVISTTSFKHENEYRSVGMIKGNDSEYIIIFVPTGTPRIDDAVSDALHKGNADYITDAKIHYTTFYIPYIGGQMRYTVQGEGWVRVNPYNEPIERTLKFDPETGELVTE